MPKRYSPPAEPHIEQLLRDVYASADVPVELSPRQDHMAFTRIREPKRAPWLLPAVAVTLTSCVLLGGATLVGHKSTPPPATAPTQTASADQTPTPDPSKSPGKEQLKYVKLVHTVAKKVEGLAKKSDPDFTLVAVVVTDDGTYLNALKIYRADSDPERMKKLYATVIPEGMTITYLKSELSAQQFAHLRRLVVDRRAVFSRAGVHLIEWGPEKIGGRFIIGFDPKFAHPDPGLLTPFEIYGKGTVIFVPARQISW